MHEQCQRRSAKVTQCSRRSVLLVGRECVGLACARHVAFGHVRVPLEVGSPSAVRGWPGLCTAYRRRALPGCATLQPVTVACGGGSGHSGWGSLLDFGALGVGERAARRLSRRRFRELLVDVAEVQLRQDRRPERRRDLQSCTLHAACLRVCGERLWCRRASFRASRSHSTSSKNGWALTAAAPSGPAPSRLHPKTLQAPTLTPPLDRAIDCTMFVDAMRSGCEQWWRMRD